LCYLTVGGAVDGGWKFTDLDFEALLDVFEDLLVLVATYERDGQALGAESASAADTVEVGVGVVGHVVVEHDVDLLDVDATGEQIRRHQESELELLESLIDLDSARY
jgi:hypothetical protein